MNIAATTAGINTMVANTSAQGGCAFACHESNPKADNLGNPGGIDNYALAQQLGVVTRIQNLNAATQALMTSATQTEATYNSTYRMAIYTFNSAGVNIVAPLTSNLSSAKTSAASIDVLQVYQNNCIVTAEGSVVQPGITIPTTATSITINQQGQVSITLPGTSTPSLVGQFALTRFINPAGLQAMGDNLFVETPASGTPQDGQPNIEGYGNLQQGNLESANVDAVTEMSSLIMAQRSYEMNSKVITAADQMLQTLSNMAI